jgi:hypothetical protein
MFEQVVVAPPATEVAPPLPDINRDPIMIVEGASIPMLCGRMERLAHKAPVWVTLIPDEINQQEHAGAWPLERSMRVLHECNVGTVEELVQHYREQLIAAFHRLACTPQPGEPQPVIPTTGEPSLRKQTELLQQTGLLDMPMVARALSLTAAKQALEQREAIRNIRQGFMPHQSAWTRLAIKELIANWSCRRFRDENDSGLTPPTTSKKLVRELISELTVFLEDQESLDPTSD